MERDPNSASEITPAPASPAVETTQIVVVTTPSTLTEFSDWLDLELTKLEAKWAKYAAPNAARGAKRR